MISWRAVISSTARSYAAAATGSRGTGPRSRCTSSWVRVQRRSACVSVRQTRSAYRAADPSDGPGAGDGRTPRHRESGDAAPATDAR